MVIKFLKKLIKAKEKGYTLLEIAVVIAVTGMLATVVLASSKVTYEKSKLLGAQRDVENLRGAIGGFFSNTGDWPVRQTSNVYDYYEVLFSGKKLEIKNFADTPPILTDGVSDRVYNHLYQNSPEDTYFGAYTGWRTRYISSEDKYDPWGKSYIVYTKPLWRKRHYPGKEEDVAWVLSGGPNGKVETWPNHIELQGDDIGLSLFSGSKVKSRS